MRAIRLASLLIGLFLALGPAWGQAANQTKQNPPIQMGTSGGSVNDISTGLFGACCAGTLGALVNYDGQLHILSNNHVLARSGSAAAGEDIVQPGLIELSCSATAANSNVVADFAGNAVPLNSGANHVDAALATVRAGMVDTSGAIIGLGVPCTATQTATPGLAVTKSGRTTGVTTGTVQAVNVSTTIQYTKKCTPFAFLGSPFNVSYTNQVSITPGTFSGGGDSGSLILSNDGTLNPVALLFAGSSAATIANPIGAVVGAFTAGGHSFSFVGAACAAANRAAVELPGVSKAELAAARAVKERYERDLFSLPGVVGVGVGKTEDKADVTTPAIVVYVTARQGMVIKGFPSEMDGVPVRLIPTDPFVAY